MPPVDKNCLMFIVNLHYKVPLTTVGQYLPAHVEYLKKQYALKNFLASGRKVPRTGGVILSGSDSKEKLLQILEEDPFKQNKVADYEVIEFIPTMTCEEFNFLT
jgi:uncharacterized protein YciI